MSAQGRLVFREYGDAAVLADIVDGEYHRNWSVARALGERVHAAPPPGVLDTVASYQSVFVCFDPLITDHRSVCEALTEFAAQPDAPSAPRRFDIPVVYGGVHGPDLPDVARHLGIDAEAVIALHTGADWTVRFVGSPLGAPLMDGPRLPGSVPRLAEPRTRVEPGSLALSGFQSIIYNAPSPGGWQVIGRTPVRLFDLHRSPQVPYRAGDLIRFRRIAAGEWDDRTWDDYLVGPAADVAKLRP